MPRERMGVHVERLAQERRPFTLVECTAGLFIQDCT